MSRRKPATGPTVLDEVQEYIAGTVCSCDFPPAGESGIIVCWRCRFASAVARHVHDQRIAKAAP